MAVEAVRNAVNDAGPPLDAVDGMVSYQVNDSTPSPIVVGDLGMRVDFYMDVVGGDSSTESLIGLAIRVIEAGTCRTGPSSAP